MRHDDAKPAAVENSGGEPMLPSGDPRNRGDAGAQGGDRDLDRDIEIHRIVFEVEEQPVIAAGLHDRGDIDRAALAEADAERKLAASSRARAGLRRVGSTGRLLSILSVQAILRGRATAVIPAKPLRFGSTIG